MSSSEKLKVLDLFSGIGGFSLGLERTGGFETVAFCEIEEYPRKVLNKHWPEVPIYEDVRKLYRFASDMVYCPSGCDEPYCELCDKHFYECDCIGCSEFDDEIGEIDVITGGFPCQDLSFCGKGEGIAAERSGLWSEIARLISELRPKYAIIENVSALLIGDNGKWFRRVLNDLASIGYDCEWFCIQPERVGIPSNRDRVWICAYPKEVNVAKVVEKGRLSQQLRRMGCVTASRFRGAVDKHRMGRGINGIPDRLDRFGGLGNAVVPQIPELIGRAILETINS